MPHPDDIHYAIIIVDLVNDAIRRVGDFSKLIIFFFANCASTSRKTLKLVYGCNYALTKVEGSHRIVFCDVRNDVL